LFNNLHLFSFHMKNVILFHWKRNSIAPPP